MTLSFLNLVIVRGVLVGLTIGASDANRLYSTGDILLSAKDEDPYIDHSPKVLDIVENLSQVEVASPRYIGGGILEANYKERTSEDEVANTVSVVLTGIRPSSETALNNIDDLVFEGEFIDDDDQDMIVIERSNLKEFNPDQVGLENVHAGTKLRLTANGNVREVTVKGIIRVKGSPTAQRAAYINASVMEQLLNRKDLGKDEIVIKVKEGIDPKAFKKVLIANDIDQYAKIQDWEEGQFLFLKDINQTFNVIGNIIGSIALVVAAITIFIIIFVNAITRRRFIGILKGIGIKSTAIIMSYVMQAVFYALIGTNIALVIIYGLLVPYIAKNPIDFPFSDGIIAAEPLQTLIRALLLLISTIIAGYVPARMIVRKNTLDSILGR